MNAYFINITIKSPFKKFSKQADKFNTKFVNEDVVNVDFSKIPKAITTESQTLSAKTVIVATGASAIWLGIPSEQRLIGKGISSCAVCDGFFFKGKDIVVVGGGDAAMEEANFLTKFANKVTVMVRKDVLRASRIMQERAKKKIFKMSRKRHAADSPHTDP